MLKRNFSESEKLKLALGSFNEGIVVTKYCAKHGISRSVLYRSRKELLNLLSELLQKKTF